MKCPKCSEDNPDTQSFCGDCGTQLGLPKDIPEVTKTIKTPFPQFAPGTSLANRYEIIGEIGKGGMGEVYLAEDTNLKRKVAIKVLPQPFALDKEMLARFEREARLLASLSHPNIATIHGLERSDGQPFLVMELVEGETLAERIKKGPLPVEEALEVCRQIAEGLEAAHERGIIHRDLKPANVKVTPEGKVKILDFGLAKAFESAVSGEAPGVDLSKSPTITVESSHSGVILGTAAYMSPEQARGKPLDKKTDIWSFGCVLFEATTGRETFKGDTISDTIAAILKSEPDWNTIPETTPLKLRDLLLRCLQKDPHNRLHDIADARIEIEDVLSGSPAEVVPTVRPTHKWRNLFWIISGLFLIVSFVLFWKTLSSPRTIPGQVHHLMIRLSERAPLAPSGIFPLGIGRTTLTLSPDGSGDNKPILGTEGAHSPAFSPDGRWIAYNSDESGRWEVYIRPYPGPGGKWRVSTDGGEESRWTQNGKELFFRFGNKWMAAKVNTGNKFDVEKPQVLFEGPYINIPGYSYDVSPDGQRFLVIEGPEQGLAVGQLSVITNWFEELKRLVPTGNE
jgi:serine/threonine-protein kinase